LIRDGTFVKESSIPRRVAVRMSSSRKEGEAAPTPLRSRHRRPSRGGASPTWRPGSRVRRRSSKGSARPEHCCTERPLGSVRLWIQAKETMPRGGSPVACHPPRGAGTRRHVRPGGSRPYRRNDRRESVGRSHRPISALCLGLVQYLGTRGAGSPRRTASLLSRRVHHLERG
jgi:hypothetical protein